MRQRGRYSPDDLIHSDNLRTMRGQNIVLPSKLVDTRYLHTWQQHLSDPSVPKVVDLFSGAGGMSEGFVRAGFAIAAAFDIDPSACRTFAANIPAHVVHTDIDAIEDPGAILDGLEVSGIDVVVGGPPCQGFSQVGRARIRSLSEEEQEPLLARNELYQHFFRFVEAFRPAFFVMENVPTLLTFEHGAYMKAIERECERLNYELWYQIIEAADYGVPQMRRRLFLIGSRLGRVFMWPRERPKQDRVTLEEAIGDLPPIKPPALVETIPYDEQCAVSPYQRLMRSQVPVEERNVLHDHITRPVREDDRLIFTSMKPGDKYIDIDPRYRRYNSENFKDKYYMLRPEAPGITITAHIAKDGYRYIHWGTDQHRTISVREAARIQSFGDHFRFCGHRTSRYHQIGNAVPPLMAHQIAEQIKRAMRRSNGWLPGDRIQLAIPGLGQHEVVDQVE